MQVLEETTIQQNGFDQSDLDHIFCNCSPEVAICGTNISSEDDMEEWDEYSEDMCIVCMELDKANYPCSKCGFKYSDEKEK